MKNIELIDKAIDQLIDWPSSEPEETHLYQFDSGRFVAGISGGSTPAPFCTRAEFLARKAERQNKPDWNDVLQKHPKAQYLAQWSGCDRENKGLWISYETKPDCENGYVVECHDGASKVCHHSAGQIIGRWQDTLEQRPAVTESKAGQIVVENCHAIIQNYPIGFNVSAAGDNDWHARGELPPAGTECEYLCDELGNYKACKILAVHGYTAAFCIDAFANTIFTGANSTHKFRPLRTDREKFIEAALANFDSVTDQYPPASNEWLTKLFGQMFDAGFRQPVQK